MIPEDKIEEVRERTDIVSLIGEFVPLKKAGTSHKGLCPFHSEKTPSFYVHRDRQFFYCFGCQASGDAIRFLMRLEGRSFPEAVEFLAARAGIELPRSDPREAARQDRAKKLEARRRAVMESATQFFEAQLGLTAHDVDQGSTSTTSSEVARAELRRRGIDPAIAQTFRLGYAPAAWDRLARHLGKNGFRLEEGEELGLLIRRGRGQGHYDRFRHRLIFPVADHQGRVIAFSGRLLPEGNPTASGEQVGERGAKYVNSPEGPLYHKGRTLYGLHQARVAVRRAGYAVLCEGNFDLVALHQAGFDQAVAPLGTALTSTQCELLRRFTEKVVLLFDGDAAGQAAVHKAAPLLLRAGLGARVCGLPSGTDPDSFLREKGADQLVEMLAEAPGITEFLIDQAALAAGASARDKSAAIGELGPLLLGVDNPVEIQLYIERIGQKFGISDLHAVRTQLRRGVRASRRSGTHRAAESERSKPPGQQKPSGRAVGSKMKRPGSSSANSNLPRMETELLGAMLDNPELFGSSSGQKLGKLLTNGDLRAIFEGATRVTAKRSELTVPALVTEVLVGEGRTVSALSESGSALSEASSTLSLEATRWLEARMTQEKYDKSTSERVLKDGVTRLERFRIEQQLPILSQRIIEAQRCGEVERAKELLREKERLRAIAVRPEGETPVR